MKLVKLIEAVKFAKMASKQRKKSKRFACTTLTALYVSSAWQMHYLRTPSPKHYCSLDGPPMKSTQRFSLTLILLVTALLFSGCASDCGCNSGTGLFGTNILQGQPVRTTVRSWFQGDSCDTCNTPAGQLHPPCENCIGGGISSGSGTQAFSSGQFNAPQVQPLYGTPALQPNGLSSQFAPQPGPVVGSGTRSVGTPNTGNFGPLATPPSL